MSELRDSAKWLLKQYQHLRDIEDVHQLFGLDSATSERHDLKAARRTFDRAAQAFVVHLNSTPVVDLAESIADGERIREERQAAASRVIAWAERTPGEDL